MPPRKRDSNDADNSQPASAPTKRQRVSLACDSCRIAREKCDGGRPNCGTCTAQNRTCSYTPASRKRGVQTGYLRTIELSLAWLFEQVPECEGALHRLLTQNEGADGARILGTKDKAGHRLYRRWNKSRVYKDIGRFLSDDKTPRTDTSADDTETEGDTSPTTSNILDGKTALDAPVLGTDFSQHDISPSLYTPRASLKTQIPTRLILPSNWQRLISIYFSYTHCWFPIVERDTVTGTALTYPPEGINASAHNSISTSHAQLWAVLAVAAFQDAACTTPSLDGNLKPARIYSIARQLIPSEEGKFETPHICALLLQSLVLLGQKKHMAAWLLVGHASRLALHDKGTSNTAASEARGSEDAPNDPKTRILAASILLDTLISLCVGHPRGRTGACLPVAFATTDSTEADEIWTPVVGLGSAPESVEFSSPSSQSESTLQQMCAFSQIWSSSREPHVQGGSVRQKITPEDLVKGLNPRFSFCNSLIFGGSTPMVPSAFLLQIMFLTITLDLVPGYRPSLFSNLIEVIESCIENFGACGTPPIILTLMEIVDRHGHINRMHDHDKAKWRTAIESLHAVWHAESTGVGSFEEHQPTMMNLDSTSHPIMSPTLLDELSTTAYQANHGASSISGTSDRQDFSRYHQPKDFLSYDQPRYPINSNGSPGTSQSIHAVTPSLTFQSSAIPGGHAVNMLQNPSIQGQLVDYDAILEELGSIDCADSIDLDPQFMANLGFAPGCDLGEMFQGDFGL